jgi:uncharacterized Zn finger protein (UPF0148 family)
MGVDFCEVCDSELVVCQNDGKLVCPVCDDVRWVELIGNICGGCDK